MRKINTRNFRVATRSTTRDVNRQIVLNLIREHQPISRAELARRMEVSRSLLTPLVRELVTRGAVVEGGTLRAPQRGRRPTLLRVRTNRHVAVAIDVRQQRTTIALADFGGHVLAREAVPTPGTPTALVEMLAQRVPALTALHVGADAPDGEERTLAGAGLVMPGMVDRRTGRVLYAPRLGWRDVDLRDLLAERLGYKVRIENAPIACALARLWLTPDGLTGGHSFAYVSISDGVGVGLVNRGEVLRGETHTAGEFGHVALDRSGPPCVCGKRGCWEALCGDGATLARYHARGGAPAESVEEVVRRARAGDGAAVETITETATHIGRGLAAMVSAFNPGRIYVGGEITAAWELLDGPIRRALVEDTLTDAARATPVVPDRNPAEYRVLGAVALVAAPTYAAPRVG
ncbi:ROK family protein [Roseisolibacter sp. H3M3-2]|uniref:ROK family transcriptional regulator n=1 Tax=Roseisolibacter sp. H3M3-2 TaxID=3031323 RepID=UPI0023DAB027|nr:ROK family protein [Roseisolibacter sp. H3M3-2]MDF1503535.1 ROK family protein [Roseisolibacter sp. H3M3-2]